MSEEKQASIGCKESTKYLFLGVHLEMMQESKDIKTHDDVLRRLIESYKERG